MSTFPAKSAFFYDHYTFLKKKYIIFIRPFGF